MNAAHALAWLHYGAVRLGWPGLLGLGLALAAATTALAVNVPLAAANAALHERIATLAQAPAAEAAAALPADAARALAALPDSAALVPLVAAIHAGAQRRQVALEQGEYTWQRAAEGRAARYRMAFPARGGYPQLRAWAAELLAAQPQLALDEFDLRRENIGSTGVDARVAFVVRVGEGA